MSSPSSRLVERFFGPIRDNPELPAWRFRDPGPAAASREVVPDAVPLVRVHVGYRCPAFGTRELDALEVATQILAGGRGSRLHRRLVRDAHVAQDVALFALPLVAGSSIAAGWVTARPDSDAASVEGLLDEELQRITHEPVTDDELVRALALIESSKLGALSHMDEVADRLSMYATYFDRPRARSTSSSARYQAVDARPSATSARRSSAAMRGPCSRMCRSPKRRPHERPVRARPAARPRSAA